MLGECTEDPKPMENWRTKWQYSRKAGQLSREDEALALSRRLKGISSCELPRKKETQAGPRVSTKGAADRKKISAKLKGSYSQKPHQTVTSKNLRSIHPKPHR